MSVCEIVTHETYEEGGRPVQNGLCDPRMVIYDIINMSIYCKL